jgi:LPXTG-motif cell wall-anchored protein
MSRRLRIALATALVLGATLIGLGSVTASAGGPPPPPQLMVDIEVLAPDASAVLSGLTIELFSDPGGVRTTPCVPETNGLIPPPLFAHGAYRCPAADGDPIATGSYRIGVDGAPETAVLSANCFLYGDFEAIDGDSAEFEITTDGPPIHCYIDVVVPAVFIDKVVVDNTASQDAFTLEVYSDPGDPGNPPADSGALVASATDPDPASCYGTDLADPAKCAVVLLDEGSYQLGEVPAAGHLPTNVYCLPIYPYSENERFPDAAGTFTLGVMGPQQQSSDLRPVEAAPFAYCEVTNELFEGDIVVEKVVVNDEGGTAKAQDFTAEVFLESDGSLATSAPCAADGSCIDAALPIGEYRVGETGPSGYTASVECKVTSEPDPPGLGTIAPTLPPWVQPVEALEGDSALFELEPLGAVTCVITNNDDPVPTTTTTTTTLAPTTTAGAQLPATGGDSDSLGLIAALGAFMLLMGGTLLVARRRT